MRSRSSGPKDRTYLKLEGLEERVTPSHTYTWSPQNPATDILWDTVTNWLRDGVRALPGSALPGSSDDVVFDNTSNAGCVLNSESGTVADLTMAGYTGTLTLNDFLDVQDSVTMSSGEIDGSSGYALTTPSFAWSGGQIGDGTTSFQISLGSDALMDISGAATKTLGAQIEVGAGATATFSGSGTLTLIGNLPGSASQIHIDSYGEFDIIGSGDIGTGGAEPSSSLHPYISNSGTLRENSSVTTSILAYVTNHGTIQDTTGNLTFEGPLTSYNNINISTGNTVTLDPFSFLDGGPSGWQTSDLWGSPDSTSTVTGAGTLVLTSAQSCRLTEARLLAQSAEVQGFTMSRSPI